MLMYSLYWGLLVAWLVLLWPAVRLKGPVRLWLLVVICAGISALAYETYMILRSSADIRLDILLISIALAVLYTTAVLLLFARHFHVSATALAAILVAIGAGMGYEWLGLGRESQQVRETFEEANRLLFSAKFRSPQTYDTYFGPFAGAAGDLPAGHWQIEERDHFTRIIINVKGRVWLFYQCQEDAECHSGPGGSGLREVAGQPERWTASLEPQVGLPFDIKVNRLQRDTLSVEIRGQIHRFSRAPPPIDSSPRRQVLDYLGPFSNVECSGQHAKVRQVWLWQDGMRLYAVAVFSTLVAGRQTLFVPALVLGEGTRQADGWHFAWHLPDGSGVATIDQREAAVSLALNLAGRDVEDANELNLEPGGIFSNEKIELAPLTGSADWQHWFDNVLSINFISGRVPSC